MSPLPPTFRLPTWTCGAFLRVWLFCSLALVASGNPAFAANVLADEVAVVLGHSAEGTADDDDDDADVEALTAGSGAVPHACKRKSPSPALSPLPGPSAFACAPGAAPRSPARHPIAHADIVLPLLC